MRMSGVWVNCSACGQLFDVQTTAAGQPISCPRCSAPLQIVNLTVPSVNRLGSQPNPNFRQYVTVASGVIIGVVLLSLFAVLYDRERPSGGTGGPSEGNTSNTSNQQTAWHNAINESLKEYYKASDAYGKTSEEDPAQLLAHLRSHVARLAAIDVSRCPPDYREAFVRLVNAWRGYAYQISQEPQTGMQGFFQGVANGLGGESDGGVRRWMQARQQRQDQIEAAHEELAAVAARY